MINSKDHPVEWALLIYKLEDAKEHLKNLIKQLTAKTGMDEIAFKTQLFHVYEHLNRAWHSRNTIGGISSTQWHANSQLPVSLKFFED
ncbi:hypothetical protein BKE30_08375 [Alkanindiges hydrocarboniclasticus]|uniref:Uncharacterized protein n=1 Tax=Alkanindiges hydrocarboniclasticus TaxID=1907941 RepID=A0A1S8CVR1_9GAMM|nr:hypothetical protein [Alkanindiges hydrocarboniclasticus]ONG39877.1 hypothetical protein BKE30_08375 [Alkanindiges hydrocarboniclasticus]